MKLNVGIIREEKYPSGMRAVPSAVFTELEILISYTVIPCWFSIFMIPFLASYYLLAK